jgi:hypothetical protein
VVACQLDVTVDPYLQKTLMAVEPASVLPSELSEVGVVCSVLLYSFRGVYPAVKFDFHELESLD